MSVGEDHSTPKKRFDELLALARENGAPPEVADDQLSRDWDKMLAWFVRHGLTTQFDAHPDQAALIERWAREQEFEIGGNWEALHGWVAGIVRPRSLQEAITQSKQLLVGRAEELGHHPQSVVTLADEIAICCTLCGAWGHVGPQTGNGPLGEEPCPSPQNPV